MNYWLPETAVWQYTQIRLNMDKLIQQCILTTSSEIPTLVKDIMHTLFSWSGVLVEDWQSHDISYSVSKNKSYAKISVVKWGNTIALECNYNSTPGQGSIQFSVNQEIRDLLENDIDGDILESERFELLKNLPNRVRHIMQRTKRKELSSLLWTIKPDEII